MKPSSGSHPCLGREKPPMVYVHSFGSHRSGAVIHYRGRGHFKHHEKGAPTVPSTCPVDEAASTTADRTSSGGGGRPSSPMRRDPGLVLPSRMRAEGGRGHRSRSPREGGKARVKKDARGSKAVTEPHTSPNNSQSGKNVAKYPTACSTQKPVGDYQETQGDIFEFPSPLENAGNVILQQTKKFAVWNGVSKVISKMVEENEHFRKRLMSCSQLPSEVKLPVKDSGTEEGCVTQQYHNC